MAVNSADLSGSFSAACSSCATAGADSRARERVNEVPAIKPTKSVAVSPSGSLARCGIRPAMTENRCKRAALRVIRTESRAGATTGFFSTSGVGVADASADGGLSAPSTGNERNRSAAVPRFISFDGSGGAATGGAEAPAAVRSLSSSLIWSACGVGGGAASPPAWPNSLLTSPSTSSTFCPGSTRGGSGVWSGVDCLASTGRSDAAVSVAGNAAARSASKVSVGVSVAMFDVRGA